MSLRNQFKKNSLCFILKLNCYDVLRLTPGATQAEVRQAYLKLAKECHPDKTGDTDTTHIFQQLCQAYWTLHDPNSWAEHAR